METVRKVSDQTVLERWGEFASGVYPQGMGDKQRQQLRACFVAAYYDAICMLAEMSDRVDSEGFPMLVRVESLVTECLDFAQSEVQVSGLSEAEKLVLGAQLSGEMN